MEMMNQAGLEREAPLLVRQNMRNVVEDENPSPAFIYFTSGFAVEDASTVLLAGSPSRCGQDSTALYSASKR